MHRVGDSSSGPRLDGMTRSRCSNGPCAQPITQLHSTTRISTYQRIVEIHLFKERLFKEGGGATVTNQRVQQEYNKHITLASKAEPINKSWIDQALKIYESGLAIPEVLDAVVALEDLGTQSPFNFISVLNAFVVKAKTKSNIVWCFQGLKDCIVAKEVRLTDISVRYLVGDGNNKGFLDFLMLQKEMKEYLLGPLLTELGLSDNIKDKLVSVFDSHDSYRRKLSAYPDDELQVQPNTTWQAGWPRPLLDYVGFIEDSICLLSCCCLFYCY
jgi:hypothetical protein